MARGPAARYPIAHCQRLPGGTPPLSQGCVPPGRRAGSRRGRRTWRRQRPFRKLAPSPGSMTPTPWPQAPPLATASSRRPYRRCPPPGCRARSRGCPQDASARFDPQALPPRQSGIPPFRPSYRPPGRAGRRRGKPRSGLRLPPRRKCPLRSAGASAPPAGISPLRPGHRTPGRAGSRRGEPLRLGCSQASKTCYKGRAAARAAKPLAAIAMSPGRCWSAKVLA
jgi:hypothetical protein